MRTTKKDALSVKTKRRSKSTYPHLVQELVEVRSPPTTVETFNKSQRMASHLRADGHGHTVTIAEHGNAPDTVAAL